MRYIDLKETQSHGTIGFPFAHYDVNYKHPRYQMLHHWHPEFEIVRILSGELYLQVDDAEFLGKTGDSFFIPGGMIHSAVPNHCHYECIVFNMEFFLKEKRADYKYLLSFIQYQRILQIHYQADAYPEVHRLFERLSEELSAKMEGYELSVQGALFYFLGYAVQKKLYTQPQIIPENLKKMQLFKKALSFIHLHYSEDITLQDMADSVPLNPHYFCRFFREITHKTPMQYLNYYRIESACEKLFSADKSITDIAMECGFNDASYFIHVFKKFKGKTPTEYLKSKQ